MNRTALIVSAALLSAISLQAEDALPKHEPGEAFDFEPKLMLDGPGAKVPVEMNVKPTATAEEQVLQLEGALLKAQDRAKDCEELYKEGVLAKVEVEGRRLKVVRINKDLMAARETVAAHRAVAVKKALDGGKATQGELDAANRDWLEAQQGAMKAAKEWHAAELGAAALDLKRKRQLFSEGVGSRREVAQAQDRLVLVSGTDGK